MLPSGGGGPGSKNLQICLTSIIDNPPKSLHQERWKGDDDIILWQIGFSAQESIRKMTRWCGDSKLRQLMSPNHPTIHNQIPSNSYNNYLTIWILTSKLYSWSRFQSIFDLFSIEFNHFGSLFRLNLTTFQLKDKKYDFNVD